MNACIDSLKTATTTHHIHHTDEAPAPSAMVFEGCPCCQPASAAAPAPAAPPTAANTAPAPAVPPLGTCVLGDARDVTPSIALLIPSTFVCASARFTQTGPIRVGVLTVSDRASDGTYEDKSGPAMEAILTGARRTHVWMCVTI